MKLGIVTTWFERGAAYVSRQYARALEGKLQIAIFARGESGPSAREWEDPRVTRSLRNTRLIPTYIDRDEFTRWIEREKPDAILFNEQWWWPPVLWARDLGVRTFAYVDYYKEETIPLFGLYDALLCNTRRHALAFADHHSVHYIPWGTEPKVFQPRDRYSGGPVRFFHSAGMNPRRKGTDIVVDAYLSLPESSDGRLIVHSQVDLNQWLSRSSVTAIRNRPDIEILEETVAAPGLYHLGDVYVYPSRLDGIGLTMAEALSCGLPIIVPDNPPMSEFVNESHSMAVAVDRLYARSDGYYWPQCEASVLAVAAAMQRYITDSARLLGFQQHARSFAESRLDWFANAQPLAEIITNTRSTPVSYALRAAALALSSRLSPFSRLYAKSPALFSAIRKGEPFLRRLADGDAQ